MEKKIISKSFSDWNVSLCDWPQICVPFAIVVSEITSILNTFFAMSLFSVQWHLPILGMCLWIPLSIPWWTGLETPENKEKAHPLFTFIPRVHVSQPGLAFLLPVALQCQRWFSGWPSAVCQPVSCFTWHGQMATKGGILHPPRNPSQKKHSSQQKQLA